MNRLTQMIKEDMKPALGVTEPGAIAFAAAKARSYTHGPIESVKVWSLWQTSLRRTMKWRKSWPMKGKSM